MKKESLEINNGKPWNDRSFWKNGFLYESITQSISMIMGIAKAFGYDQSASLTRDLSDPKTSLKYKITDDAPKSMIVIDGVNDDKTVSDAKLLADNGINPNDENYDMYLKDTHFLRSIIISKTKIDDNLRKNTLFVPAFNQTIDSRDDLAHLHLDLVPEFPEKDLDDVFGTYNIMASISTLSSRVGNGLVDTVITNRGSSSRVAIKFNSEGVAGIYPKIDEKKFDNEYVPYIKEGINAFISKIGSLIGRLDSIYNSLARSLLSRPVIDFLDFFMQNGFVTEKNGIYSSQFEDTKLMSALHQMNNSEAINWLAVKAFVLGYNADFSTEGYERWINSNWTNAVAENHGGDPIGMVGVRSDFFRLDAGSDDTSGLTPWMHRAGFLNFNPTLSIQDNWTLNGETFDNSKYPTIQEKKDKFAKQVQALKDAMPVDGFVLTGTHYVPASGKLTQSELLALQISALPPKDDVQYSNIVVDENKSGKVSISMDMKNIHINSEVQSEHVTIVVSGFQPPVNVQDTDAQLQVLKGFLTKNNNIFGINAAISNPFSGGYVGGGIVLSQGSHLDLSNVKLVWKVQDTQFDTVVLNLSNTNTILSNEESMQLLNPIDDIVHTDTNIASFDLINKLNLELKLISANQNSGEVNFIANIYPQGNKQSIYQSTTITIKLPTLGN